MEANSKEPEANSKSKETQREDDPANALNAEWHAKHAERPPHEADEPSADLEAIAKLATTFAMARFPREEARRRVAAALAALIGGSYVDVTGSKLTEALAPFAVPFIKVSEGGQAP